MGVGMFLILFVCKKDACFGTVANVTVPFGVKSKRSTKAFSYFA